MEYDSIPFDRMSPDTSIYRKGLAVAEGCVPADGGGWLDVSVGVELSSFETLPGGGTSKAAGTWTDPAGMIWLGTTHPSVPSSRLYEVNSAGGFTNRTPAGAYAGAPATWRFTKFGSTVIAAPENVGVGAAIQLQSRSAGNFGNLVTSADRPAPKFVGICKSYLVWANNLGGAGVYAAANAQQVGWSARNNAAVHTPGTDRSGFAPDLPSESGAITGLWCFADFFLVFQEYRVTRFTWIGGDAVWEPQDIAFDSFGAPPLFGDSGVRVGRDLYYISHCGPAVIRNGEAAAPLTADCRRFLSEIASDQGMPADPARRIEPFSEPKSGLIGWLARNQNDQNSFLIVWHEATERLTVIPGGGAIETGSIGVGVFLGDFHGYPLSSVVLVHSSAAGAVRLSRFHNPAGGRTARTARFRAKRWRPATGVRAVLQAVRPLVVVNNPDVAYAPTVQVTVSPTADPRDTGDGVALTSASLDGNGFFTSDRFPMEGNEFDIVVDVLNVAGSLSTVTLREVPAIELAYSKAGAY